MSAAAAAASAAALGNRRPSYHGNQSSHQQYQFSRSGTTGMGSRYELQKQRDWNKFDQYRKNKKPVPLTLHRCSSEHVLDFIGLMLDDQSFDWGSLDAVIGRLRVAFVENGGSSAMNPFLASEVKLYLLKIKEGSQVVKR